MIQLRATFILSFTVNKNLVVLCHRRLCHGVTPLDSQKLKWGGYSTTEVFWWCCTLTISASGNLKASPHSKIQNDTAPHDFDTEYWMESLFRAHPRNNDCTICFIKDFIRAQFPKSKLEGFVYPSYFGPPYSFILYNNQSVVCHS